MSFRLAAYAICLEDERVLLVHERASGNWTLPGGGVERAEDPFDTVVREIAEETGCRAHVERLLGVDSRLIPSAERMHGGPDHQNIGIFYEARITGGELRTEPSDEILQAVWTPVAAVARLRRSSLVDVGLALARTHPASGHVPGVPVGGLIQH